MFWTWFSHCQCSQVFSLNQVIYDIFRSCPPPPFKWLCWQPSWKYLKLEASWSLKNKKVNKPTWHVYIHIHAYTHGYMYTWYVRVRPGVSVVCMEGRRGRREKDLNISFSLLFYSAVLFWGSGLLQTTLQVTSHSVDLSTPLSFLRTECFQLGTWAAKDLHHLRKPFTLWVNGTGSAAAYMQGCSFALIYVVSHISY